MKGGHFFQKKTLKTPTSLSNASFSDACLLLPALGVHAEHNQPEHQSIT
jgi:hypothetical protein